MLQQDTRKFFYMSVGQLLTIVIVGLLLKFGVFDIFKISGGQMAPTSVNGDRVLFFRTPYLPVLRNLIKPGLNKPVLVHLPVQSNNYGFLRVAGRSGDTVSINSGEFFNFSNPDLSFPAKQQKS